MGLSTTYTKTETDFLIQQLEKKTASGYKGDLIKTDVAPTSVGFYGLLETGVYTNLGGINAQSGKLNFASFDGTTWSLIAVDMPKGAIEDWSAKTYVARSQVFYNGKIYETSGAASSTDIPGTSNLWVEKLGVSQEDSAVATVAGIKSNKFTNAPAFKTGFDAEIAKFSEQIEALLDDNKKMKTRLSELETVSFSTSAKLDSYRFGNVKIDYYISDAGSDANSGTTIDLPFASFVPLLAMPSNSLDNKVIAIKCGSSIPAMDLTPLKAKNCIITTYGEIELGKPFIDCTAPLTETWSEHQTGVWKVELSHNSNIKKYPNFFKNGVPVQKVTSISALAAASNNAVYADNQTASTFTLYMKSSVNPSTDGNTYRWSKYGMAVYLVGEGSTIDNLRSFGNGHQDGAFVVNSLNNAGGCKLSRCRIDWGNRHSALVGSGAKPSVAEFNEFYGGADDVETGNVLSTGSVNAFVFNTNDHSNAVCIDRYNIYDGLSRPNYNLPTSLNYFTAGYGHEGIASNPMLKYTALGNTYRNILSVHSSCGQTGLFKNCTFDNVSTFINVERNNGNYIMENCRGNIEQLLYGTNINFTFAWKNNDITVRDLARGTAGFVRYGEGSGSVNLTFDGGSLDVRGVRAGASTGNNTIVRVKNGNLKINNLKVYPKMGTFFTNWVDVQTGGTFTFDATSGNNTYPVGTTFRRLGVNYSLAEWISAGYESNTSQSYTLPVAELYDDFSRSDKLLTNDVYVNLGGVTDALAINSNKLATLKGNTQVAMLGNLESQNRWCRKITQSTAGSSGIALLAKDQNNFILLRETSSAYQIQTFDAGNSSILNSSGVTPAIGDEVIAVMRYVKDFYTGNSVWRVWIIVNNKTVLNQPITMPTALASIFSVGFVARGAANPLLSDASWCSIRNQD